MTRMFAAVITLGIACCSFSASAQDAAASAPATSPAATDATAARTPVVVELFTSEGCSSCPPADKLLTLLDTKQPLNGTNVIALEEHVDYWNHDGWTDPYSSARWTERQKDYASFFKKEGYTPQVVIDGKTQLVGNQGMDVAKAIQSESQTPKTDVTIVPGPADAKGNRHFTVNTGKLVGNAGGDSAEIWLVVTENGLHNSVTAGENSGQTLQHSGTVRSLQKIGVADPGKTPQSFSGDAQVKFDSKWNTANTHVVVFIQEKKSRQILGATSVPVTN
jgi:hypothetical protein